MFVCLSATIMVNKDEYITSHDSWLVMAANDVVIMTENQLGTICIED